MATASDELCRLLDERGAEHQDYEFSPGVKTTSWDIDTSDPRYEVCAAFEEFDGGTTFLRFWNPTPEQAVEATLGRETCHLKEVEKDCDTASEYMIDREWCFDAVYRCSCGCTFGHVAHDRPRFCPNCGRKVVDEEVDDD